MNLLKECKLCPRNCGINRYENRGVCGAGARIKVSHYSLHMWEEPVISGINGSGTVFFSHCNLRCIFCQNKKISTGGYGKEITNKRFLEILLELQKRGAHNINLVTPTHYVPQIVKVLQKAKDVGLNIPIVYNTSSYENVETIKLLDGLIDVFLADLKYFDDELAKNYSNCNNYFEVATAAIDEMYQQVGSPIVKDNLMLRGIIVRILILPGHKDDAKKIIKYLYEKYKDNIYISIMNQYTPVTKSLIYPNLNWTVTDGEYAEVVNYACDLGVTMAFMQDGETACESFIPDFNCNNI